MPNRTSSHTPAVMINIALTQLRRHPGRIIAVLLAVMISVGYLIATLTFLATETHAIAAKVSARTSGADVVITPDAERPERLPELRETVASTGGVGAAEISYQGYGLLNNRSMLQLQSIPDDQRLRWGSLDSGAWPAEDQIAIGRSTAEQNNLRIGDLVEIETGGKVTELGVSGIVDEQDLLLSGAMQTALVQPTVLQSTPDREADLLAVGDGSISAAQLADRIDAAIGSEAAVQTSAEYAEQEVENLTQGAEIFSYLLLIFGVIALLVGAILIVNTFLILLAQRRRQVGLLRAVGASGSQVRRSILVEAAVVGLIGSLLGVGLGIGVAAIAAAISGSLAFGLAVPPTVVAAAVVGLVVTVLSALLPAGRATRVSPLEALRPVAQQQVARRSSIAVGVVAVVLAAIGGAMILYGLRTDTQPLLLSVAGSLLIATAVLIGARLYFPLLLRLIGLVARPFSPVARLATDNAARNPGRAAATGAALMLAVGLIVTLQVGAGSVRESTNVALDAHYPVDITVVDYDHPLSDDVVQQVANTAGVLDTATLRQATVELDFGDEPIEMTAVAGDDAAAVVNEGGDAITDDHLLIDPFLAENWGVTTGQPVTLTNGSSTVRLTAIPHRLGSSGPVVVSSRVLAQIAPNATQSVLWAQADPNADVVTLNSELTEIAEDNAGMEVGGALSTKAVYKTLLDTLLLIATALLGVAAVIALLGIGNTLGLSVIERTRESALLRALGLSRGQLRAMITVEAVLLSIGGALVGIVAGIFFGLVGTHALSLATELNFPRVLLTVSPGQTAAVVGIAVVAGVLASVLPGRRAATAAPVEALAET